LLSELLVELMAMRQRGRLKEDNGAVKVFYDFAWELELLYLAHLLMIP